MVRAPRLRKRGQPESDEDAFRHAVQEIEHKIHSRPVDSDALRPAIQKLTTLAGNGHKLVGMWPALESAIQAVFPHHKKWDETRTNELIMKEVKTLQMVADDDPVEIAELRHIKKFCESFAKAFQQILVQHRAARHT